MVVKVPSLSSSGWISETAEKTDKLLSFFFVSEASQSNLYAGKITSLPNILRRNGNDDFELKLDIQRSLQVYLERHYDSVEVNVTVTTNTLEGERGLDLSLDILVVEDGKQYSVGRLVSTLNSSIMKIAELNNSGAE